MGLFNKNEQKPRAPRQVLTAAQKTAKEEAKAKKEEIKNEIAIKRQELEERKQTYADLRELSKQDPSWKRLLIQKEFGISAPESEVKTKSELKKEEFEEKITEAALKKITEDPEFEEELARSKAWEILGSKPKISRGNQEQYVEYGEELSPIAKMRQDMRDLNELKEELGGGEEKKGSLMDLLKDPDIVKAILSFAATMFMNKGQDQPQIQNRPVQVRTYVVQVDGVTKELSEPEYLQLKQTPVPVPTPVPEPLKDADQNSLIKYLSLEPQKFVEELNNFAENESPQDKKQAEVIQSILTNATYEGIVALLTPYKEDPRFKVFSDMIINRKEWTEEVIKIFNNPPETEPKKVEDPNPSNEEIGIKPIL